MKYSKTLLLSSICASLMFGSSVEGVGLFDIFKSKKEKKQKVDKNSNKAAKNSSKVSQKSTEVLKNSSEVTQKSSNGVIGKSENVSNDCVAKDKKTRKKGAKIVVNQELTKSKDKNFAKKEATKIDKKECKTHDESGISEDGPVCGLSSAYNNTEIEKNDASNSLSNGYASTQNLSEDTSDVKKDQFELSNIINPNDFRDQILAKRKLLSNNILQEAVKILQDAKKIQQLLGFNPLNENALILESETEETKQYRQSNDCNPTILRAQQATDLLAASAKIGELMIIGNLKNDIPQRPIHQVFGDSKFRKNVEKAIALKIYGLQILLNSLLNNNLESDAASFVKNEMISTIAHHASTILYLAPNYIFNEKLHKYLLNFCAKSFAVASLRFENRELWYKLLVHISDTYGLFINNENNMEKLSKECFSMFDPLIYAGK